MKEAYKKKKVKDGKGQGEKNNKERRQEKLNKRIINIEKQINEKN